MRSAILLSLASALLAGSAGASGFMISKMGGDLAGATEPNAAAVFWNPAAIGPIEGASLMLDFNLVWRTMNYERAWSDETVQADRPSDPGQMSTFDTLPMAAFTINPRLDWLTLGVGVYVPFGNRSDWAAYDLQAERQLPEAERQPMPPQAFHTLTGGLKAIYTTPTVALRPLGWLGVDWLWFGLGVSWVYAEVDATRLKDFSPDINELLGFEFAQPEQMDTSGTVELDFSGNSWAFALGLYARPLDWLRLGVSWTSGSKLVLPGSARLHLPGMLSSVFGSGPLVESSADLHMELPPTVRAGVHLDLTDWLVFRINFEYVTWRLYRDVRIHELAFEDEDGPVEGLSGVTEFVSARNYRDAFDLRAGFRFFPYSAWMIFCGVGYDTNAVPDATVTPDLYDADKIGLALGTWFQIVPLIEALAGAELDRDDRVSLAIGLTWVRFLDRTVAQSQADPPIAGDYRSNVLLLNTNLQARF
jgi:long-chain fatty acid transport protein